MRREVGEVDILMGGPPCQGDSDLNNHKRRNDTKNSLYPTMARAAEVLLPRFVVIENVPTVRWDTGKVVEEPTKVLDPVHLLDDADAKSVIVGDPRRLTQGSTPTLVDDPQQVPESWDLVRRAVDANAPSGSFLLTGPARPFAT